MTDIERDRVKAICEVAGVKEIDDLSDGSHTFRQLYYQRMVLFAAIVKQNKDKAWKSLRHENGELCFGSGWFIVGIDTPKGSYTYHYEDNYFSLFDCVELERGKHWDGHTEKDVVRLLSLPSAQPEQRWTPVSEGLPYMWDERYLVSLAWGGIGVMEYKSTGFHNYGSFTPVPIESITAWMPSPEPYKGGQDGQDA